MVGTIYNVHVFRGNTPYDINGIVLSKCEITQETDYFHNTRKKTIESTLRCEYLYDIDNEQVFIEWQGWGSEI